MACSQHGSRDFLNALVPICDLRVRFPGLAPIDLVELRRPAPGDGQCFPLVPGVDAVREYSVLSHSYGAEYGKRAGGQISFVPTSGTNQWHGSAFEFRRNSALDTRNFFDDVKGPFKRNQFGGTLGGPIKKDKLFLFGKTPSRLPTLSTGGEGTFRNRIRFLSRSLNCAPQQSVYRRRTFSQPPC